MRAELKPINDILQVLLKLGGLARQSMSAQVWGAAKEGIEAVNNEFYGYPSLNGLPVEWHDGDTESFLAQFDAWLRVQCEEFEYRKRIMVKVDYDFHRFMMHIKYGTWEQLVEEAVQYLHGLRAQWTELEWNSFMQWYDRFSGFWGKD